MFPSKRCRRDWFCTSSAVVALWILPLASFTVGFSPLTRIAIHDVKTSFLVLHSSRQDAPAAGFIQLNAPSARQRRNRRLDGESGGSGASSTTSVLQASSAAESALPLPEPSAGDNVEAVPQYVPQQQSKTLPLVQLALAGAFTTLLADAVIHPIDCIKTLQQSDLAWQLGLHSSMFRSASYLFEASGLAGFYHGFFVYAFADAVGGACKFAVWETWKQKVMAQPQDGQLPSLSHMLMLLLGAGLAFLVASVFIVPGELLKQQLQMEYFPGLMEAVRAIGSTSGISGFFVGYDTVCFRDVPYTMLELGFYEVFKMVANSNSNMGSDSSASNAWKELAAASVTGAVAAVVTTPLDVIKTKVMVDTAYAGLNFYECFQSILDSHGWAALFCGVEARIAWIVPFLCIYLPLYDAIKRMLWQQRAEFLEL